ncbi:MAG: ribonuclease J, partial [Clostridia bacterium]|nr:ribonuclease J [Clostridia bacterium]
HPSEDGLIIVVIGLDHEDGTLVSGPDIVSRGFVYVKENEDIMEGARATVRRILDAKLYTGISTSALKDMIREALSRYIYDTIKRNPMILTIIV